MKYVYEVSVYMAPDDYEPATSTRETCKSWTEVAEFAQTLEMAAATTQRHFSYSVQRVERGGVPDTRPGRNSVSCYHSAAKDRINV